jgi:hypothetical protein
VAASGYEGESRTTSIEAGAEIREMVRLGRIPVRIELEPATDALAPDERPAPPTQELQPPPPPANGYLRLASEEPIIAILDDREVWRGRGTRVIALAGVSGHRLELREPSTFSRRTLDSLTVAPGDTLDLAEPLFRRGTLAVAAMADGSIAIDGEPVDGTLRAFDCRLGEGRHELRVEAPGFRIESATLHPSGQVLLLDRPGDGSALFSLDIEATAETRVYVDLRKRS